MNNDDDNGAMSKIDRKCDRLEPPMPTSETIDIQPAEAIIMAFDLRPLNSFLRWFYFFLELNGARTMDSIIFSFFVLYFSHRNRCRLLWHKSQFEQMNECKGRIYVNGSTTVGVQYKVRSYFSFSIYGYTIIEWRPN